MNYMNPQMGIFLEKIYEKQWYKGRIEVTDIIRSLIKRDDSIIMSIIWESAKTDVETKGLLNVVEQCIKEAKLFKKEEFRIEEFLTVITVMELKDKYESILNKYYENDLKTEDLDFLKSSNFNMTLTKEKSVIVSFQVAFLLSNILFSKPDELTINELEKAIIAQWYSDIEKLFKMFKVDCYNSEIQKFMINYMNRRNKKLLKNQESSLLEDRIEEEKIFDDFNNDFEKAPLTSNKKNEDDTKKEEKTFVLAKDLQSYCTVLNDQFSSDKMGEILGRNQEVENLFDVLLKRTKRNAVLVGEAGVGKTAIVEELARRIVIGECPEELKECKVIQIDTTSIIAGTKYRGEAEKRFKRIQQLLTKYPNIIAFIDEIHTVLGAGSCEDSSIDMSNALKPILAKNDARIIGATTTIEYEKYFSKDPAFKRRFEMIEVKEPKISEVYSMIKNKVKALEEYHGVKISKKMIDVCIFNATCFNLSSKNPDRTIDLLDKVMGKAKKFNLKSVNKKCLEKVYAYNYERYEKMTIEDKTLVAYHEAGHYIVDTLTSKGERKVIAVTIVPSDDSLGANILERDDSVIGIQTRKDIINQIAMCLGGRVGEKLYTGLISSGASSDLEKATAKAYRMVTKLGMGKSIGVNRIYSDTNNDKMYNQEIISKIDAEVNAIIGEAYILAKKIIAENEDALKQIVQALLDNGVVAGEELEKIINNKKIE